MTQAFNLSQLANNLNTSGQLDATDGLTGAVPVANGGTGLTAVGTSGNVLTSNGSVWTSTAIPTPTIADGSITDPKISDGITAGSTYIGTGMTRFGRYTGGTAYVLFAQAYILRGGVFNFTITVNNQNVGNENSSTIGARIYRNGVAISAEATAFLALNTSTTFTFTSVSLSRGGFVQLYCKNSAGDANRVGVENWNYGIATALSINPFTPVVIYEG